MDNDDERREQIAARVRRMREFYTTLTTYIFVNLLLLAINLLTNPHKLWFYWVTVIWGIVLLFQAMKIFTVRNPILGKEWEKRKVEELLKKEREREERRK